MVELLWLTLTQPSHKTLNRVVGTGEAVVVHQVLVDGRGVAPQPQLRLDEARCGSQADTDAGVRGGGACAAGSVATPGDFAAAPARRFW